MPEPEVATMLEENGIEMPEMVNSDTGFIRKCGVCYDPCSLKWMPQMPELELEEEAAMQMREYQLQS